MEQSDLASLSSLHRPETSHPSLLPANVKGHKSLLHIPDDFCSHILASDGKNIPPEYEVGSDSTLRVSSNESKEYEHHEESADIENGIQAAEYGWGKQRKTCNQQYNDFWCH